MPRINRIRIVNFSYNNDTRHILDETFDFHGGVNALLNLANGGGKSVLVQLFLQPVVPGARIQGRNLAAFFHKQKLPSYIMTEWKLDGAGGYLLTGIGIVPVEAQGAAGEERSRLKYFTFTSQYTQANAFDLPHISLVNRKGGVLEVMPFREARAMLTEQERKDPLVFGYFAEEEAGRYAQHLAQFGISQEEWRNVIARINDNEGGLEEIFQKCKTSGQLLNDWVIKTVEKAMFRDKAEAHRLEAMLENLVQEVVENERFIIEKQLLDEFSGQFQEQANSLNGLLTGFEQQQQLAGKLAALHSYLHAEAGMLQEQLDNNRSEIATCHAEEQRVQLEERSHDYHLRQAELETAQAELTTAEQAREATQGSLDKARVRELVLRAARIAGEIDHKAADLAGVAEQLATARQQFDSDTRIQRLEYSLKLRYEEDLQLLAAALEQLRTNHKDRETLFIQTGVNLQAIDGESSRLAEDNGRLEERRQRFESDERAALHQLGLAISRNLLGELIQADVHKTGMILDNNRKQLEQEINRLRAAKTANGVRLANIATELQAIQAAREEQRLTVHGLDRDIHDYDRQEAEISKVLDRYGWADITRFERERLATAFTKTIQDLEDRKGLAARTRDQTDEALHSIKQGRLHAPAGFASWLASLDIRYQTGETYLRSQPPALRQQLLEANPILPYAFIMSRAEIDRVATTGARLTMRQAIPLIAHEDLGRAMTSDGRVARLSDGLAVACLYEGRMFDNASLEKLAAELEQQRSAAQEQYAHLAEAAAAAVADSAVCARFNYTTGYREELEQKRDGCRHSLQQLGNQAAALDQEKASLTNRQDVAETNLRQLERDHEQAGKAVALFAELLGRERDYQDCLAELATVRSRIASAVKQKIELTERQESLRTAIADLKAAIQRKETEQGAILLQYSQYKDAPEAETVAGSSGELEQRLKAVKAQYSLEIEPLELRKQGLESDLQTSRKQLAQLGLEAEQYAGVTADEQAEESNKQAITQLTALLKIRQKAVEEAVGKHGATKQALADALKEVTRLGAAAPLALEAIMGNFAARRQQARRRVDELEAINKNIAGQINVYRRLAEKIEQLVDPAGTQPEQGFVPEGDPNAQLTGMERAFRQLDSQIRNARDALKRSYDNNKALYRERNLNIDNIFKGLDPLWDKPAMGYADYYYLYERTSQHLEKLAELIKLYELQLANLEQDKKDMVQQSWLHGLRIYEEMQWISENSRVRLQGKNRPVQMLKIDLQFDNNHAGMLRMQEYIEGCITQVREATRQNKREDEVRKLVVKLMASRELLDVFLGTRHIPVSVFKVDLNAQHSRLKLWEDAVRENSGGEKFVVFFAVLAALMAYTRARTMEAAGGDPDTDTRVLVMDNPFGPISSEHLLNPLFEIARKYRTQLICLSDLKQNSIMNCFNLIYMLKVRTSVIGSNEYLKFEEIVRDESAVLHDEKLEKAIFRASDFKQVSLFEEM